MKKIICLMLVVVFASSLLAGCTWKKMSDLINLNIFHRTHKIEWEEKVYCNATVEDDFVPGHVLILLDKAISEPNKVHSKNFFAGVEIEEIIDLSCRDYHVDSKEEFRQMLLLILVDKTKEAVIEAIKTLEQIEGIKAAEPDWYAHLD